MSSDHIIQSRSSWWDDKHWIYCTCGTAIWGRSQLDATEAWRTHCDRIGQQR